MAEIVSLKLKRKQKARDAKEKDAAANRARFGRTKSEKKLAKAREELADRQLEAHKLEDDEA